LEPNDAESYKELADCLYDGRNEISMAIEYYSKAISIKPKYYQAYLGRAHVYENIKPAKKKDALNDYRKAVEINPELKDIYNTNSDLLLMARIKLTQNGG
jgi:Tfp pilus assembly protein PilF